MTAHICPPAQFASVMQDVRQLPDSQLVPSGQGESFAQPWLAGMQALVPMALRQRAPAPHSMSLAQPLRQAPSKHS